MRFHDMSYLGTDLSIEEIGQSDTNQDQNDGNHDQQLNQRKTPDPDHAFFITPGDLQGPNVQMSPKDLVPLVGV